MEQPVIGSETRLLNAKGYFGLKARRKVREGTDARMFCLFRPLGEKYQYPFPLPASLASEFYENGRRNDPRKKKKASQILLSAVDHNHLEARKCESRIFFSQMESAFQGRRASFRRDYRVGSNGFPVFGLRNNIALISDPSHFAD